MVVPQAWATLFTTWTSPFCPPDAASLAALALVVTFALPCQGTPLEGHLRCSAAAAAAAVLCRFSGHVELLLLTALCCLRPGGEGP